MALQGERTERTQAEGRSSRLATGALPSLRRINVSRIEDERQARQAAGDVHFLEAVVPEVLAP